MGSSRTYRLRSGPLRSFVGLDLNLMAHIVDIPLQEVGDLFDQGAVRETVPKLGNVNRGPGPCMLSAHGQPPLCLRLTGLARLALLVAGNTVWDLLLQANLLLINAIARPPTLSLITGMECDKPAPPGT